MKNLPIGTQSFEVLRSSDLEDLKEIFSYSFRDSNKDDVQQLIFKKRERISGAYYFSEYTSTYGVSK